MFSRRSLAVAIAIAFAAIPGAQAADPPCGCFASVKNLAGSNPPTHDYVPVTAPGVAPNLAACTSNCIQATANLGNDPAKKQLIEDRLCRSDIPKAPGMAVKIIAKLGQFPGTNADVSQYGSLVFVPEMKKMTCSCQSGWTANQTGNTATCSKEASGALSVTPHPVDGTAIGTYGFIKGGKVHAYGPAASCAWTVVQAGTCKIQ